MPSYNIDYKYESITLNIIYQAKKFLKAIRKEHKKVQQYVQQHNIEEIISDNRFGCYSKNCNNIFITHQIRLIHKNAFIQALGTRINKTFIEKFNECWVPDYEGDNNLSGEMSHNIDLNIPVLYIGPKSRFTKSTVPLNPKYKTLSIISGPEPQRSKLEEILILQLKEIEGHHAIVRGYETDKTSNGNINFFGLCEHKELESLISESSIIISRSGYSSVMDYEGLGRKAILIPTPGQTEQEYLARKHGKLKSHVFIEQSNFILKKILSKN